MNVEFGNNTAVERYRDLASETPNAVLVRPYPGEHITLLVIPDEQGIMEAFSSAVGIFKLHSEPDSAPAWVESENKELERLLKSHYKIKKSRPDSWGKG